MNGDRRERSPYRPVPRDFVARWPLFGWSGAELEWHAHARTIARWVDECGREKMILARKAYLDAQRQVQGRARRKRYVLGRTLDPARGERFVHHDHTLLEDEVPVGERVGSNDTA